MKRATCLGHYGNNNISEVSMTQRQRGNDNSVQLMECTTMAMWPQDWAGFHTRLFLSFSYLCAKKVRKERENRGGDMAIDKIFYFCVHTQICYRRCCCCSGFLYSAVCKYDSRIPGTTVYRHAANKLLLVIRCNKQQKARYESCT